MGDDFTLFETMLFRRGQLRALRVHMQRLSTSAKTLGFAFDEEACRLRLEAGVRELQSTLLWRVRLDLSRDGGIEIRSAPLEPLDRRQPVFYVLARSIQNPAEEALVRHKTSLRSTYDGSLKWAQALGAFDAIFFNEVGELTEGARTNVFVRVEGVWKTPHLDCGVLPGTMRARVLGCCLGVQECSITRAEFQAAERIVLSNALRGLVPVERMRTIDHSLASTT